MKKPVRTRHEKGLILMGMKHCGKTTLGTRLAERLGLPFHDLDELLENLAAAGTGSRETARELYRRLGKEGFQDLELRALRETAERLRTTKASELLALGGGTIENAEGLAWLADLGIFIYLEEREEVLFQRILAGGLPPFLQGPDPKEAFHLLFEKRTALYRLRADLVVPVNGLDPDEGVRKIMENLGEL